MVTRCMADKTTMYDVDVFVLSADRIKLKAITKYPISIALYIVQMKMTLSLILKYFKGISYFDISRICISNFIEFAAKLIAL